jgi:hypothetical protein
MSLAVAHRRSSLRNHAAARRYLLAGRPGVLVRVAPTTTTIVTTTTGPSTTSTPPPGDTTPPAFAGIKGACGAITVHR